MKKRAGRASGEVAESGEPGASAPGVRAPGTRLALRGLTPPARLPPRSEPHLQPQREAVCPQVGGVAEPGRGAVGADRDRRRQEVGVHRGVDLRPRPDDVGPVQEVVAHRLAAAAA